MNAARRNKTQQDAGLNAHGAAWRALCRCLTVIDVIGETVNMQAFCQSGWVN
jgi:hypothetical protein